MKQVEVTIMGQSYVLGCHDGGERALLDAVGQVDQEMCAIRDGGKVRARERIAVLAALNLAYALVERPSGSDATARGTSSETSTATSNGVELDALVKRIDQALRDDGQLI